MGERRRDFILCVFLLLYQALILPTASPANLPGIVTRFIGSASYIPDTFIELKIYQNRIINTILKLY